MALWKDGAIFARRGSDQCHRKRRSSDKPTLPGQNVITWIMKAQARVLKLAPMHVTDWEEA